MAEPRQEQRERTRADHSKQLAGLHDDELLVESYPFEFVLGVLREDLPEVDDGRRWAAAERLVAAVRGAGGQASVDSLAEARGFRDAAQALANEAHRRMGTSTGTGAAYEAGRRDAATALATVKPGALSAASPKPAGVVPLEPQEERLRTALEHIRDGTTDCEPAVFARAALSAVPLLQDGGEKDG